MTLYYSPSVKGFLDDTLHSDIPVDAVKITPAQHQQLMAGQSAGKKIGFDAERGRPIVIEPTAPLIADRRATAVAQVRAEAGRRIELVTPLWRQSNDNILVAELAWRPGADLTDDQAAQLATARARRAAIDAVRDASNQLEAAIGTMTVTQLKALDVTHPDRWPTSAVAA